jgi:NitT/TauT family transport system substrate-binding protein
VGTTGLLGLGARPIAAEPPPETTTIRLTDEPYISLSPQYVAEELLRAEGLTDILYVKVGDGSGTLKVAFGEADMVMEFAGMIVSRIDAGDPLVALAGVHVGCFELFATDRIQSFRDLKGKTVAVLALGAPEHLFLSSTAAYVGLDPRRDITWVPHPPEESMRLMAEGKVDGLLALPPEPQELRAKKVGHVVVNTATDRPWSEHFCCMLVANGGSVRKYPVATKRALRAILKATDAYASEPERVARFVIDKGFTSRLEYTLQALKEVPYNKWRVDEPENTVRFFVPRLHEIGMIKSTPQKIIAQGTDWCFLNELKKELKG